MSSWANSTTPGFLSVPPVSTRRSRRRRRCAARCSRTAEQDQWDEWDDLLLEFEERAQAKQAQSARLGPAQRFREPEELELDARRGDTGRENPDQYAWEPIVDTAFAAATMYAMWSFGRVFGGESIMLQFYPLPLLFCSMQNGPEYARIGLAVVFILLTFSLGPMATIVFALSQGMVTLWLIHALWHRWHYLVVLVVGVAIRIAGLVGQMYLMSLIGGFNFWRLIYANITNLLTAVFVFFAPNATSAVVKSSTVRVGIACLIAFHSLVCVFATHFSSTLLLYRFNRTLRRQPVVYPFVRAMQSFADDTARRRARLDSARKAQSSSTGAE